MASATVYEAMTALADAVRTKSGATGSLTIDQMTEVVNGISTGAISIDNTTVAMGVYSCNSSITNGNSVSFDHNLGRIPDHVIFALYQQGTQAGACLYFVLVDGDTVIEVQGTQAYASIGTSNAQAYFTYSADASSFTLTRIHASVTIRTGSKYAWLAW